MIECITTPVEGSPYQPGQRVKVGNAIDITPPCTDVREFISMFGVVDYPEYPMIGVSFPDGQQMKFWSEELAPIVVMVT